METKSNFLTTCVVKIASLCNLNCSYCYMYNKGDDSYKKQPKYLSHDTITHFFSRLDKYFETYEYDSFAFVFHGGEPMLAKQELYLYFIEKAKEVFLKHKKTPTFLIQTNGVLLDKNWIDFFLENEIHVGISLDSTKESNDTYRVYHNGKSAYDNIIKGFELYKEQTKTIPGLLSVIDMDSDPHEVYEHYKSIGADYINLLFPDETFDSNFTDDLKLGKWLLTIYNLWLKEKAIRVDQFEVLLAIFYGADFIGDEYYGLKLNNTFILETDGELQANDPLRVCMPNIHKTKLNVKTHDLIELLNNPLAELYYNSKERLCKKCQACELNGVCSGGYLINRYSKLNGFDNPSIYCKSLAYFIVNVQNSIADFTNPKLPEDKRINKLNLDKILSYCENSMYDEIPSLKKFAQV
jgi:uncharacterized protein